MRLIILVTLSCLLACKGDQHHGNSDTSAKPLAVAEDTTQTPSNSSSETKAWADYKINTRTNLGDYEITIWVDTASIELVVANKLTHKKDTLQLEMSGLSDRPVDIKDLTQDIGSPRLTLCLTWQGDSDNDYSEVVGYKQDTLQELFRIPSAGGLVDLHRKDPHTLIGHAWGEDDVIRWPHNNYILRVSLPHYDVYVDPPDTLKIDDEIEVKETIHAFRQSASGKQIPRTILPGTKILVDTIYFPQHMVSFHLNDSTRWTVPHDSISGKLKISIAG
jgi:hypothetical protein